MGLVERSTLITQLTPPLENLLATQIVDEFISAERRFIQRDWEPAELDGGQFAEALARILYHQDSGSLPQAKKDSVDSCLTYIEDKDGRYSHAISPRSDTLHLAKVVRTIYKFRNERGAVHISSHYKANHMDARLIIECVRWCMNETLRMFWNGNQETVAKAIRELLQFDVPAIGIFEGKLLVQRTDLTAEEELLILLHFAGETGFTRKELGTYCRFAESSITVALQKLSSPKYRQVEILPSNRYCLTDLGSKRIREQLAEKLLLQNPVP